MKLGYSFIILLLFCRIDGNNFHIGGSYQPWNFPSEYGQNISDSPKTDTSAIENFPSHKVVRRKKKLGPGGVASIIGGVTFFVSCAALLVAMRINKSRARKLLSFEGSQSSFDSLPLSAVKGKHLNLHLCYIDTL